MPLLRWEWSASIVMRRSDAASETAVPGPERRRERTGESPGSQRRGTTRTSSRGTRYPSPERSCEDGDRERASVVIALGVWASRVALRCGHRPTWGPAGDSLFCLRRSTLGFANAALLRGRTKTRRRRVCGALAWQGRLVSSRRGRCEEQEMARCVRVMRGLRGSLFLDLFCELRSTDGDSCSPRPLLSRFRNLDVPSADAAKGGLGLVRFRTERALSL